MASRAIPSRSTDRLRGRRSTQPVLRWRITGFQSMTSVEFMSGWIAASLGHVHRELINFLEARENKNPFFFRKQQFLRRSMFTVTVGGKGCP